MKPQQQNQLSQSLVPNSIAYKKTNLELAQEALLLAKSIPRKVRRASSNECEFSRKIERNKTAEPKQKKKEKIAL